MRNRIGEILEHQGRSVTWLARRMGCNRSYLSQVINGHIAPSAVFRAQLAVALDLPADLLFFGDERPIDRSDTTAEPAVA